MADGRLVQASATPRPPTAMNVQRQPRRALVDGIRDFDGGENEMLGNGGTLGDMIGVKAREREELESQNMNLKLLIYDLEKRLQDKGDSRRNSDENGFYDFDKSDSRRSSAAFDAATELQHRESLSRLEEAMKRLERERDSMSAQMAQTEERMEVLREEVRRGKNRNVELENFREQAMSEKLLLKADREVLQSQNNHLQQQMEAFISRARENVVNETAAEKLAAQVEKEKHRVEDADRRVERMREAVSLLEATLRRTEARVTDAERRAQAAKNEGREWHDALKVERKTRLEAEEQLRVAVDRYIAERERAEIENRARTHQCDNHVGRGACPDSFRIPPIAELEQLIGSVDIRHDYVDVSHDNLSKWRHTVLKEINGSLRMLYCFQRQVEQQRDEFVQEYARRVSIEALTEMSVGEESRSELGSDENQLANTVIENATTVESRTFTGRDTTTMNTQRAREYREKKRTNMPA